MKHTTYSRLLAGCLAAALSLTTALPAFAEPAEYSPEEGVTHTVYWAEGITPPALTGEDAAFTENTMTLGEAEIHVLAAPYEADQGWFDLNQELPQEGEPLVGSAGGNLFYWWVHQNQQAIDDYVAALPDQQEGLAALEGLSDLLALPADQKLADSAMLKALEDAVDDCPDHVLDLIINGYTPAQENPNTEFTASELGGFFNPVFGTTQLTGREEVSDSAILKILDSGKGLAAAILLGEEVREFTVWGAEYDADQNCVALYITDSLDGLGMVRMDMNSLEAANAVIVALYTLDIGTETWEAYQPAPMTPPQQDSPQDVPDGPILNQAAPVYEEAEYQWSEDYKKCTATRREKENPDNVQTLETENISSEVSREATCSQEGQTTYKAIFSEVWAGTYREAVTNLPKADHDWAAASYSWSEDHKTCTASRVCKNNAEHTQSLTADISSSQKGDQVTYTASFSESWAETRQETETVETEPPKTEPPATETQWGETYYTWDADRKTCIASRVDNNDSTNVDFVKTTDITSEVTQKATCDQDGQTTYTAKFSADWAGTATQVDTDQKKTGHDWGPTQYRWSEDHHKCVAVRICKNDGAHKEEDRADVMATVTKKPTADEKGITKYEAAFHKDWAEDQTEILEDIDPVADSWREPTYKWSDDNRQCTATRVNKENSDIVETAEAKVTSKRTKEPTTTKKGETTYTAAFREDWAKDQTKKVSNIPTLPGNGAADPGKDKDKDKDQWEDTTYEWAEDFSSCTASRVSKKDSKKVETAKGKITRKETKKATCAEEGSIVYTAKFTETWAKIQTRKDPIPALEHELKKVPETAGTAGKPGMKEHYECKVCHKLFSDDKGKHEVKKEDLLLKGPQVASGMIPISAIPEKDNMVSVPREKIEKALKDHPDAKGYTITVGPASMSFSAKDLEAALQQSEGASKIQLLIYRTDATDSSLTLDQIQTLENNPEALAYRAVLLYVKNGKNLGFQEQKDARLNLPYTGKQPVMAYEILTDGSLETVESLKGEGAYVEFTGDSGLYLLSDQEPAAAGHKKSGGVGMYIWIGVLVLSGLAVLGLGGFFLYQKMQNRQDLFEEDPFPKVNKPAAPKPAAPKPAAKPAAPRPAAKPAAPKPAVPKPAAPQAAAKAPASGAPFGAAAGTVGAAPFGAAARQAAAPVEEETYPTVALENPEAGSYETQKPVSYETQHPEPAAAAAADSLEDPELDALLKELDSVLEEKPAAQPAHSAPRPVTPLAPKAPMQSKPTIAEKTAQAAAKHEKNHGK